jgi:sulfite exporter TauE/SafE
MILLELLAATLFSSLVGSMHCVGMCTPFAILAMGPTTPTQRNRIVRMSSYHLGRLTTYLIMGVGVAFLSSALQWFAGGNLALQVVGWSVGVAMIVMGTLRLLSTFSWQMPVQHSAWAQRWTSAIVKLRRAYSGGPVWLGAYAWGLTSTLLPCGWLYLFVLAAAAAPSASMAIAMMFAFWLGTLPLLSVAAWGWSSISPRWQIHMQPIAAGCIISFGVLILVQRNLVDFRPSIGRNHFVSSGLLSPEARRGTADSQGSAAATHVSPEISLEMVRQALDATPPCCRGDDAQNP